MEPPIDTTGDRERRFLALYERNGQRIDRLCRLYARGDEVDDLRSEVALQLWRSLDRYGGRSSAGTWVYRVALNTALQHARDRGRHRERQVALAAPEMIADERPSAPERVTARRQRERLFAAMRRLPELDRAILALHLDEVPYAEIAEITGLTANHVGVRLHRARRRLAESLASDRADPCAQGGAP